MSLDGPTASAQAASADASDIQRGDWIDRWTPPGLQPYLRLMRLDRPIGTWLLLFPCWWGATLASSAAGRWPDPWLLVLFAVGALVMRGAGCIVNDMADRDFDRQVARTRSRPLASGALTLRQAVLLLALLLLIGLAVLAQMNAMALWVGVASLPLVVTYPFMKRITYWPQAFLGLTFNWGALLGWVAVTGTLAWPPVLLYLGGLFWTLGYDTIYAHQDKEDDALVGVKSSALRLGSATRPWLVGFYGLALGLWLAAGIAAGLGWLLLPGLALAALHLGWQAWRVDIDDPRHCLALFKANRFVGWLVLLGMLGGMA